MSIDIKKIKKKESEIAQTIENIPIIKKNKTFIKVTIFLIIIFWLSIAVFINFYLYPNIDEYKPQIEAELSKSLAYQVKINKIEADWNLFRPEFTADEVVITDINKTITINNVKTTLSILPLLIGKAEIHEINLDFDTLLIEKKDSLVEINGIEINKILENQDSSSELLDHAKIILTANTLKYLDKNQSRKQIEISNVSLIWENNDKKHYFVLNGVSNDKSNGTFKLNGSWNQIANNFLDDEYEIKIETKNLSTKEYLKQLQINDKIRKGVLSGDINIVIAEHKIKTIIGNVKFEKFELFNKVDNIYTKIDNISTNIKYDHSIHNDNIRLENFLIKAIDNIELKIEKLDYNKSNEYSTISAEKFDVNQATLVYKTFHYLLADNTDKKYQFTGEGNINQLNVRFDNKEKNINKLLINGDNLSFTYQDRTYFNGISGKITYYDNKGNFSVSLKKSKIFTNKYLESDYVEIKSGKIDGDFELSKDINVNIKSSHLENDDLSLSTKGKYNLNMDRLKSDINYIGQIEITTDGRINNAKNLWKYMSVDATHELNNWLKMHIKGGEINKLSLTMNGELDSIPNCQKSSKDCFDLNFDINNTEFLIPTLNKVATHINGRYMQKNDDVLININDATTNTLVSRNSTIVINNASVKNRKITVKGNALGDNKEIISTISKIIPDKIKNIINESKFYGLGELDFNITYEDNILNYFAKYKTENSVVENNKIKIKDVHGEFTLKDNLIEHIDFKGSLWGNRIQVSGIKDLIKLEGKINTDELVNLYIGKNKYKVSGSPLVKAEYNIGSGIINMSSDLVGLKYDLTKDINKKQMSPLSLSTKLDLNKKTINAKIGSNYIAVYSYLDDKGYFGVDDRNLNLASISPKSIVLNFGGNLDLNSLLSGASGETTKGLNGFKIKLKAKDVLYGKSKYTDLSMDVEERENFYILKINSDQLVGTLRWKGGNNKNTYGTLSGDVDKFVITQNVDSDNNDKIEGYPDLDIKIKNLYWTNTLWGSVAMSASTKVVGNSSSWKVQPLSIKNSNDELNGMLIWNKNGTNSNTDFNFNLNSNNVGDFLSKLGSKNTVKGGKAVVKGQLTWKNSPVNYDTKTLNGSFNLNSKNGQFLKMEPGAGKLLGLLSLQALPQRFFLDFKDVFGEGLAYSSIEGDFTIKNGIMTTDNLEIDTSAARILMKGSVDLYKHTQDFKIEVRPSLSNIAAIGVTVINPIAGAATFLAGKVLKDPLSMLFSSVYHVTGTWANPEVDKKQIEKE